MVMDNDDRIFQEHFNAFITGTVSERRLKIFAWLSASVAQCANQRTRFFIEKAIDEKIPILQTKEIILQSYLFCGFPAAIEGLIVFNRILHDRHLKDENFTDPRDPQKIMQDGLDLCRLVYGKNYAKLLTNMAHLSSDISQWMITEGYGKVLSRGILNVRERELAVIAALAVQRRERQLISHIRGAYHAGVSKEEIGSILLGLTALADEVTVTDSLRILDETLH